MHPRPLLIGLAVVALAAAGAAAFFFWPVPAIAPVAPPRPGAFHRALVKRGAALAALGGCATCHTAPGGRPYAGGRALATPFGTIFSTNITPDPKTGIGKWSQAAFARALREGLARSGRRLYPAFPYDHFTRLTGADIRALYAFVMTREPVAVGRPENRLAFPFNIRALLKAWNLRFLDRAPIALDKAEDAQWNRGHYLVAGIGHCGACHTPRNALGAEESGHKFEGGKAEGWDAPGLRPLLLPQPWSERALVQYLRTGLAPPHEGAAGPMLEIVHDLAAAPDRDVAAIAHYLTAVAAAPIPPRHGNSTPPTGRARAAMRQFPEGARLFRGACAGCHGADARRGLPPLAFSTTLAANAPTNAVNVLCGGIPMPDAAPGYAMPGFAGMLTDTEIAELLRYLRARFTTLPQWKLVE